MAGQLKLRAAQEGDLLRLKALWREGFPGGMSAEYFFENCFAPGAVQSSLVLLEDEVVQSMLFFLPTFWYDGGTDDYSPTPCLVGLTTAREKRGRQYAAWLTETACDFLVEKGAGGVWTLAESEAAELFFLRQGFWSVDGEDGFSIPREELPVADGRAIRPTPEDYEAVREMILRGRNHIVSGSLVTKVQRDSAERDGGSLFLLQMADTVACAIAVREGEDVHLREFLCPPEVQSEALSLLAKVLPGQRYIFAPRRAMLRLMNDLARPERPKGYLGCGIDI